MAAAAVAAFALVAYLAVTADAWDPMWEWGIGPLAVVACAAGLGLRVRALRAAAVAVALAVGMVFVSPWREDIVLFYLVPFWAVLAAVPVLAGAGARRLLARRGGRPGAAPARAGLWLLGAGAAAALVGVYLDHRVIDRSPERPELVDDRSGAFRGVRVGAPLASARRALGAPELGSELATTGAEWDELSGPTSIPDVDEEVWRYPDALVMADRRRIAGYATTSDAAQTGAGVGVGNSLEIARRRYRNLVCDEGVSGSDTDVPDFLYCHGSLSRDVVLYFGGDPIDAIWVYRDREVAAQAPGLLERR